MVVVGVGAREEVRDGWNDERFWCFVKLFGRMKDA